MKVLVLSGFKTGTMAFQNAIKRAGFDVVRSHGQERPKDVDYIINIVRFFPHICMSAFFQDNWRKEYPYYVGSKEEICASETSKLFEVFKAQQWERFSHVNYRHYWDIIKKNYGVNLDPAQLPQTKEENGYKVITLALEDGNEVNSRYLSAFLNKEVTLKKEHASDTKWSKDIYSQFKKDYANQIIELLKPLYVEDPVYKSYYKKRGY